MLVRENAFGMRQVHSITGALHIPPHCVRDNVQVLNLYWKLNMEENASVEPWCPGEPILETHPLCYVYWNSVCMLVFMGSYNNFVFLNAFFTICFNYIRANFSGLLSPK